MHNYIKNLLISLIMGLIELVKGVYEYSKHPSSAHTHGDEWLKCLNGKIKQAPVKVCLCSGRSHDVIWVNSAI